jgi:hypothetical protein
MSLTQCPNCRRRCFTDAEFCPTCFQTFQPGFLQTYAVAKEKAFSAKANMLFLILFLIWVAVVLFFQATARFGGLIPN